MSKTTFVKTTICLFFSFWGQAQQMAIPQKNKAILDSIVKYGATISPTYEKAVCTEMVIQLLEKFQPLTKIDKTRIRIITNNDVHALLNKIHRFQKVFPMLDCQGNRKIYR